MHQVADADGAVSGRIVVQLRSHPFVIGELACGNLKHRHEVLTRLAALPSAIVATDREALLLIERRKLMAKGLGYIDVHLLASTTLGDDVQLWTRDRRLRAVATDLRLAAALP